jgi:pSer/pThr/pTyr-binding forkhead associated (FHA) protein
MAFLEKQRQKKAPFMNRLRFVFEDNEVEVEVPIPHKLLIGRSDEKKTVDFDLTEHGAYGLGVSREHIRLEQRYGRWFVIDLESDNGTWLNDKQMYPMVAYELRSGTEIRLSDFHMCVYFQ